MTAYQWLQAASKCNGPVRVPSNMTTEQVIYDLGARFGASFIETTPGVVCCEVAHKVLTDNGVMQNVRPVSL